jgi:hypothetical protein
VDRILAEPKKKPIKSKKDSPTSSATAPPEKPVRRTSEQEVPGKSTTHLLRKGESADSVFDDLNDSWCQLDLYDDDSGPLKGMSTPMTTMRKGKEKRPKPDRAKSGQDLRRVSKGSSKSFQKEKTRGVGRSKSDMGPATLGI